MSQENDTKTFRYPLRWRIMDALEAALDVLWPRRLSPYSGWALIMPALLLVGILVLGLFQIAESSLHVLDRSTFMPAEEYTLANYEMVADSATYWRVLWRSLLGAGLTVFFTLLLALPYSYIMVRTPSAAVRKALLVALFLPFFIGQVVRAYGILIVLGTSGAVNDVLGLFGVEPVRLLFNFPAVVFGLVQYMLPFAVLMLAPALTAIPRETETAASSLGANWVRTFWHVVIPMAKPGLVGAGLVVGTLSLTDFAMPAMLGGGSQDFIANAIYDQFFRTADQGLGAALALLLVALGSILVGIVIAVFGAGTLGMGGKK
ncbi:ABC transporter permease [Tropicimonas isoalkanivorans]|uniref:Putative spermidine/putrescine transport system permease protein n=1 Tax=Tropicimonas isoalkanivorans TaxID=441112 RepID=A0A1I1HFC7_9RHOB|nr:ABC transporter permease [Tropicimonas isoalkanivorans]SFC22664.1 putative spermidine/putrescine transport system permease protein [Tropicimonas isoalkanivorans]